MPKLKFQDPTGKEMTVEISEAFPEITIGRNPGNVIRINNPSISRSHAKILFEGGRCTIFDLNSSNGSFVNGKKVRSQVLKHGDRVRCGGFPLEFVDGDAPLPELPADLESAVPEFPEMAEAAPDASSSVLPAFSSPEPPAPPMAPPVVAPPPPVVPSMDMQAEEPPMAEPEPPMAPPAAPMAPPNFGDALAGGEALPPGHRPPTVPGGWNPPSFPGPDSRSNNPPVVPPAPVSNPMASSPGLADPEPAFSNPMPAPQSGGMSLEMEQLKFELDQARRGKIEAEARLRGLENKVKALESGEGGGADPAELAQAVADRDQAVADLNQTVAERDEALADRDRLQREQEDLHSELEQARSEARTASSANTDGASKLQIDKLRKDRERLHEERRNLMRENHDLKLQIKAAPDPEEVAELRDNLKSTTEEREELLSVREDHENTISERDETISTQATEIEDLQAQVENLEETRDQLQGDLDASNNTRTEAEDNAAQLQNDLDERDSNITELQGQIEDLQGNIESLTAERDKFSQSNEDLRASLGDAPTHETVRELREEIEDLKGQVSEVTEKRDSLQSALQETQDAQAELANKLQEVRAELEKAARLRDRYKNEREEFRDARDAFYRENENLKNEDTRKKAIFDELAGDLRGLIAENSRLQEELSKAGGGGDTSEGGSQVAALQEQLRTLTAERDRARNHARELEEDLQDLQNSSANVEKLQGERDELASRVKMLESSQDAPATAVNGGVPPAEVDALRSENEKLRADLVRREERLEREQQAYDELLEELERVSGQNRALSVNGVQEEA